MQKSVSKTSRDPWNSWWGLILGCYNKCAARLRSFVSVGGGGDGGRWIKHTISLNFVAMSLFWGYLPGGCPHIYKHAHIHTYTCAEREKEREPKRKTISSLFLFSIQPTQHPEDKFPPVSISRYLVTARTLNSPKMRRIIITKVNAGFEYY